MTISTLIKHLDQLKEQLDSFRPIPPKYYHKIMQKLHLDWNYNSNSIEGNTLTLSETKQLLYYGLTAKGKPINDHKEMQGHAKVLKRMEDIVHQEVILTESLIKEFHSLILVPDYDKSKEQEVETNPGHWKKQPNYLLTPTGEKLEFLPPEEVPAAMNELINWANNQLHQNKLNRHNKKKYNLHPLAIACAFHKRFIEIHPFGDGNGRMARILMNLILMQQGYMPAIVYLEQRQEYYRALNTSTFEDISPLASYIGQNLMKSMQLAIEGAQGKPVEEQKDWMKELSVLERKLKDEEDRKKYKEWSVDNQQRVIEQVIFPLLDYLEEGMKRFGEIYEYVGWLRKKAFKKADLKLVADAFLHSMEKTNLQAIKEKFLMWNKYKKSEHRSYSVKFILYNENEKAAKSTLCNIEFLFEYKDLVAKVELSRESRKVENKKQTTEFLNIPYNETLTPQKIEQYGDQIMASIVHYIQQEE